MDRFKLSREQRHTILRAIVDRRNWLHRLHMRMRAAKWNEGDATYLATLTAHEAMHKLALTLQTDPNETPTDWMKHIGPER